MNGTMDFHHPGNPMYYLLHQSDGTARRHTQVAVEQKPIGWTEGLFFLGIVAVVILFIVALDRWERRKMKEYWNSSTKGGNHHAQHQKTGGNINEH